MELYDNAYKTLYPVNSDKPENYAEFQSGVAEFSIGKAGILDIYEWLNEINHKNP